jgi:hypothetical protein
VVEEANNQRRKVKMTPEEYWNQDGVRLLNDDGTIPTVEERVTEAFRRGAEDGSFEEVRRMMLNDALVEAARKITELNKKYLRGKSWVALDCGGSGKCKIGIKERK